MTMPRTYRFLLFFFLAACLLGGVAWAQHTQPARPAGEQKQESAAPAHRETAAEQHAQGAREAEGEDETAEFKQSPSVKWLAKITGLRPTTAYWISIILNFAIIAGLIILAVKSRLPAMFRDRTAAIQKNLEEARRASEEARRRLTEIESRLAWLDTEIADMRKAAESEAKAEEERIRAATEEDKRGVVRAAEQEIAAAAKLARGELKAYAAELAVSLAEKRIQVDKSADQELVRSFVGQLREDGKK